MAKDKKNLEKTDETNSSTETLISAIEKTDAEIHAEMEQVYNEAIYQEQTPQFTWGHLINKSKAPVQVKYNNTTFTLAVKGISEIIRKDLIQNISKGAITTFKDV